MTGRFRAANARAAPARIAPEGGQGAGMPREAAAREGGESAAASKLQLCQWNAQGAIEKHLVSQEYPKERRKRLTDSLWGWITAKTPTELESGRNKLLRTLDPEEKTYLLSYYEPSRASIR
jgi:hypothetical protein